MKHYTIPIRRDPQGWGWVWLDPHEWPEPNETALRRKPIAELRDRLKALNKEFGPYRYEIAEAALAEFNEQYRRLEQQRKECLSDARAEQLRTAKDELEWQFVWTSYVPRATQRLIKMLLSEARDNATATKLGARSKQIRVETGFRCRWQRLFHV